MLSKLISRIVLLMLPLVFVGLAGCSDDKNVHVYNELLFVSDSATLKTAVVNGGASTEKGSAELPGIPGTYTRSGTLVTVTIQDHALASGDWVDLVFAAGTGGTATSGMYRVTTVDADNFTIDDIASGTITDGTLVRKFATELAATYSQTGTTITVTFNDHNLGSGDDVRLLFTSGDAADMTAVVDLVPDANTFTVTSADTLTTSGNVTVVVGANYSIFGIAMHPNGKWVYVTSTYSAGGGFWWGNGLISRFSVNWSTGALAFEKSFAAFSASGQSAPITPAISPDGAFLYNQDDDYDGIMMWSIDPNTGDLTLVAEGGGSNAYLHGVAVSADGTKVYNGDIVFDVDASIPSITYASETVGGGNSNAMAGSYMFVADDNFSWGLRAYDVSVPAAPTLIDYYDANDEGSRVADVTKDGLKVVTSGWCGLKSYTFDGATLTNVDEYIGCDGTWLTGGIREMYRAVSVDDSGTTVASAYFNSSTGNNFQPSGYKLFSLAADGTLTLVNDYQNAYQSRVVKFFRKP